MESVKIREISLQGMTPCFFIGEEGVCASNILQIEQIEIVHNTQ